MAAPISPALKSSARAAYRALLRASGATFSGDNRLLYAFREKVRTETIAGQNELDSTEYQARIQHAFEVAAVLKKNVVQATNTGNDTYRLRLTPDTELGSNDTVKAPYSRPKPGTPRVKCGEDPNAVAPLPPKSLRTPPSTGTGSARSFSTQAPSSDAETGHDNIRVQSIATRLSQVNRRVSASPTGKGEPVVEPALLEDKLDALAARIEYLAQTHAPITGHQRAMDALLDVLWLSEEHVKAANSRADPPAQMRQFVRYLYAAGKAARDARDATTNLSPVLRTAISECMETPAPRTKTPGPHTPVDELRAIIWRALMVKRGIKRVLDTDDEAKAIMSALQTATRRTLSLLTFAQSNLNDLEQHGPRNEDAWVLMEELERVADGPVLADIIKEVQDRIKEGTVWSGVDREIERSQWVVVSEDGTEEQHKPTIRQPFRSVRSLEEQSAIPPPIGSTEHAVWRIRQVARSRAVIENYRQRTWRIGAHLDRLVVIASDGHQYQHRASLLREARSMFSEDTSKHLKRVTRKTRKLARRGTAVQWARLLQDIWEQTKLVPQHIRSADTAVQVFMNKTQWMEPLRADEEAMQLFLKVRMEMLLSIDAMSRVTRRLKQDHDAMIKISTQAPRNWISLERRRRMLGEPLTEHLKYQLPARTPEFELPPGRLAPPG